MSQCVNVVNVVNVTFFFKEIFIKIRFCLLTEFFSALLASIRKGSSLSSEPASDCDRGS